MDVNEVKTYFGDLMPLAMEATTATITAFYKNAILVAQMLRPIICLLFFLLRNLAPLVSTVISRLGQAFACQSVHAKMLEVAVFATLAISPCLGRLLHKRTCAWMALFRRQIFTFADRVRTASSVAVASAPRTLFGAAVLALNWPTALGGMKASIALGPFLGPVMRGALLVRTLALIAVSGERRPNTDAVKKTLGSFSWEDITPPTSDDDGDGDGSEDEASPIKSQSPPKEGTSGVLGKSRTACIVLFFALRVRAAIASSCAWLKCAKVNSLMGTEKSALKMWVVFGAVWTLRGLAHYACPSFLTGVQEGIDGLAVYALLWNEVEGVAGSDDSYRALVGFISGLGLPVGHGAKSGAEVWRDMARQFYALLRVVRISSMLSEERLMRVRRFAVNGGAFALFVLLAMLPRIVASTVSLVAGILVPCWLSTSVVERSSADGTRKEGAK